MSRAKPGRLGCSEATDAIERLVVTNAYIMDNLIGSITSNTLVVNSPAMTENFYTAVPVPGSMDSLSTLGSTCLSPALLIVMVYSERCEVIVAQCFSQAVQRRRITFRSVKWGTVAATYPKGADGR